MILPLILFQLRRYIHKHPFIISIHQMLNPYEERAGMLLKTKKKELRELKKKILSETGFFGKRKLKKEIKNTTEDIEYLKKDIFLYRRGVAWNKKKSLKTIRK